MPRGSKSRKANPAKGFSSSGGGGRRGQQNNVGGERITRSSRAKLNNGLEDPAQVEKELNAQLRSMGLYAANITGDGNCLFRALSDQLYGYPNHHTTLRQNVCDYLESRSDKFAAFIDVEKPFEEYVRSMRQSGTYGGHLELSAFAHLKQKEIKIVQPGLVYVVSGDDESPKAVEEREKKEQERLIAQSRSQPGSEGPPPTERALRRIRRAKRSEIPEDNIPGPSTNKLSNASNVEDNTTIHTASSPVASSESTESVNEVDRQTALATNSEEVITISSSTINTPSQIEAYGPLWIAYHNWEHYSSIRNVDGPHTGLPRVNERRASEGRGTQSGTAINGTAQVKEQEEDSEPTAEEALVLRSTRGYSLEQVRFYIKRHGGWEDALEAILANETVEDDEESKENSGETELTSDCDGMAESQATMLAIRPRSIVQSDSHRSGHQTSLSESTDVSARTSHSPMPEHLRDWRAISPSSVDTVRTQSSMEVASASTHATTDESPEANALKYRGSNEVRRSKRTASKDPTANLRSPKRRSRSRSPMQSTQGNNNVTDHIGAVAANAIANISVDSGEQTPSDWAEYASSPLGRSSIEEERPQRSIIDGESNYQARSRSGGIEDPEKTPRAKMAVTPRPVTRTLTMRERRELRKADKVRKALDAKNKREIRKTAKASDDENYDDSTGQRRITSDRSDLLKHHGADVKGFLELKI